MTGEEVTPEDLGPSNMALMLTRWRFPQKNVIAETSFHARGVPTLPEPAAR
jgi:hypothetical protein